MELELVRIKSTPHSITGKLAIDGVFQCFTVERPYSDPDFKPIPCGTYPITIRQSIKFGRLMPHVEDVVGRDGIEIHWGNYPKDSHGCIIVGNQLGDDAVWASMIAFNTLFDKLVEPVTIKISNIDGLQEA